MYKVKFKQVEAFQYQGSIRDDEGEICIPDWAVAEYDAGRLFRDTYGDGKKGLFYSKNGSKAYRRYFVSVGSYVVKWPDGNITVVAKSVFERIFEKAE